MCIVYVSVTLHWNRKRFSSQHGVLTRGQIIYTLIRVSAIKACQCRIQCRSYQGKPEQTTAQIEWKSIDKHNKGAHKITQQDVICIFEIVVKKVDNMPFPTHELFN